jgi:hypothetical protein
MRRVLAEQQQRLQVAQHAGETEEQAKAARTVRKQGAKIGRNDLCPCGSGKKFKHCHGRKRSGVAPCRQRRRARQATARTNAAPILAIASQCSAARGRPSESNASWQLAVTSRQHRRSQCFPLILPAAGC